MECQICSKGFPSADTLQEHVGFFQSRAQYHVRELLKCLAHANSQSEEDRTGDIDEDSNIDVVRNDNFDNSEEEEQDDVEDDTEDDDLHCPLQVCEQKEEFEKLKDLTRHFATHISCHEFCSPCDRVFDRASTYLHHNCKKGKSNQKSPRNISQAVLRRRKVLREKVERELRRARKSRRLYTSDGNPHQRHKRRRTEVNDTIVEVQTDTGRRLVDYIANEAECTAAGTLLNNPQLEPDAPIISLLPDVDERGAADSANIFSDGLTAVSITSTLETSNSVRGTPSFSKAPIFSARTTGGFPCSGTEYGSKAPAMYFNAVFGSKAPLMYSDRAFESYDEGSIHALGANGYG